MFSARFANGAVTAPGLAPARAAVQHLLPGIKIANVLLVSHRAPVCRVTPQQRPGTSPGRGHHGGSFIQTCSVGQAAGQAPVEPTGTARVILYMFILGGELTEFRENGLYFSCAFGLALSKPFNSICVKRF